MILAVRHNLGKGYLQELWDAAWRRPAGRPSLLRENDGTGYRAVVAPGPHRETAEEAPTYVAAASPHQPMPVLHPASQQLMSGTHSAAAP